MKEPKLYPTRYRLISPDGAHKDFTADLKGSPGYPALREIIAPLLDGGASEHVSVWADFDGGRKFKALDMFVDDRGLVKRLPRNEIATEHYRRANLMGKSSAPKVDNPEKLSFICGPAILFDRRVWF